MFYKGFLGRMLYLKIGVYQILVYCAGHPPLRIIFRKARWPEKVAEPRQLVREPMTFS